jgi:DNA-binding Lrp family transcriptional regulator
MRIKYVPAHVFSLLDETDRRILCLSARADARSLPFLTGLSKSAVYRRLARLRRLGFDGEGVYLPFASTDHTLELLEKPILVISREGCVYIPDNCGFTCDRCPLYGQHMRVLARALSNVCNCLWPPDMVKALEKRILEHLGRGFEVEL